jgi:hypothetical protein
MTIIRTTILSALLSFVVFASTDARAYWKQFPASLCVQVGGNVANINNQAQLVNATGSTAYYFCPILTSSADFTGSESTANFQLWGDNNGATNGVAAEACVAAYNSTTVSCGVAFTSGTTGQFGFAGIAPAWSPTNAADSYYLSMKLLNGTDVYGYDAVW